MKPVPFTECNSVIAKHQPEYTPLPAYVSGDAHGRIVCCWELTWLERIELLFTGRVWHSILTFNTPLQPQLLEIAKPMI